MNLLAQSLSPQTNQNNALGSDPGLLHLKRSNREVLIGCACGVFVFISLVFPVFNALLHHYFASKMPTIFSKRQYQPNHVAPSLLIVVGTDSIGRQMQVTCCLLLNEHPVFRAGFLQIRGYAQHMEGGSSIKTNLASCF